MPTGTYTVQAVAGDGTTVATDRRADGRPGHAGQCAGLPLVPQQGTTRQPGRGDGKLHQRKQHRRAGAAAPDQRDQRALRLQDQTSFTSNPLWFLGTSTNGPAGTLRPGETGRISIPYEVTGSVGSQINFDVQTADDSQPIDWASQEPALQLPTIPDAAWPAVFANFVANVGSTVASLPCRSGRRRHLPQPARPADRRRDPTRLFRNREGQRKLFSADSRSPSPLMTSPLLAWT